MKKKNNNKQRTQQPIINEKNDCLHSDLFICAFALSRLCVQVGSKTDCVMCFGPMVPDGYGVCYNPMDEHINIAITAFNSCEDTNAANFAQAVKKALLDMRALLTETAAARQWSHTWARRVACVRSWNWIESLPVLLAECQRRAMENWEETCYQRVHGKQIMWDWKCTDFKWRNSQW